MFRYLCVFTFKLLGWQLEGSFEPLLPKFIVAIAPHTSNWDFPLGIILRSIASLKGSKFLGKSQLFKFPQGYFFRAVGGYPVERTKFNNLVDSVVDIFNSNERFVIGLTPEGTRSKVDGLKTGFYHIAKKANVPIYLVGFDYALKRIIVNDPFYASANISNDFEYIIHFFSSIHGKNPELGVDKALFEAMKNQLEMNS